MTIRCAFMPRGAGDQDVLVVWRVAERGWVEVRGLYDVREDDPLQRVLDALPGPLVGGELMAGQVATVTDRMYAGARGVLEALLAE